MGVGNLRGTALAMLAIAVPLLIASMVLAARGSLRARFVWLGCLAYIAYKAAMFCFAAHFNSYFLLFTTLLALSFWSLLTLLRAFDPAGVQAAISRVPSRTVAVYLLACAAVFALLWLQTVVPATLHNEMPTAIEEAGLTQNPFWVLDFVFTFPLSAVPVMLAFTVAGLVVSILFLRRVSDYRHGAIFHRIGGRMSVGTSADTRLAVRGAFAGSALFVALIIAFSTAGASQLSEGTLPVPGVLGAASHLVLLPVVAELQAPVWARTVGLAGAGRLAVAAVVVARDTIGVK